MSFLNLPLKSSPAEKNSIFHLHLIYFPEVWQDHTEDYNWIILQLFFIIHLHRRRMGYICLPLCVCLSPADTRRLFDVVKWSICDQDVGDILWTFDWRLVRNLPGKKKSWRQENVFKTSCFQPNFTIRNPTCCRRYVDVYTEIKISFYLHFLVLVNLTFNSRLINVINILIFFATYNYYKIK